MTAADAKRNTRSHWEPFYGRHHIRDTVYRGKPQPRLFRRRPAGPRISSQSQALGLLRMKHVSAIKETTEWVCRDQVRALQFMTT